MLLYNIDVKIIKSIHSLYDQSQSYINDNLSFLLFNIVISDLAKGIIKFINVTLHTGQLY